MNSSRMQREAPEVAYMPIMARTSPGSKGGPVFNQPHVPHARAASVQAS